MTVLLKHSQLAAALIVLIHLVSAQTLPPAEDGSPPQLHFVAQLSVSGCVLFVHDTGSTDGPHLVVEPIVCVTESLRKVAPRYDPITEQTYVSVPVTLRDDAMLTEVQNQLRHLSPKSVKFVTVSDISVSNDASSKFRVLGFIWSSEETKGFLRLGCKDAVRNCSVENLAFRFKDNKFDALDQVTFTVTVVSNDTALQLQYRATVQNRSFVDVNFYSRRFQLLPKCQRLRFVRSVRLTNCTALVHQRLDMKGHFLIEPLLYPNITRMSNKSVMYDYSRDMHFLQLALVMQDDIAADAVRAQLVDLSPRSVAFMRLWGAQSHVASKLSRRFVIDRLMLSGDGRSGQLRVYSKNYQDTVVLRSALEAEPVDVWRHVKWSLASLVPDSRCILESINPRHIWRMLESGGAMMSALSLTRRTSETIRGDRRFVVIQQRRTGSVSFERSWVEYERGFGDESDFWIGLSRIHELSVSGTTLRVEMKLRNGTELHAEYAGFKVGSASTNYTMTFREMMKDKSSARFDAMGEHDLRGKPFSALDRDPYLCSNYLGGKGGWWFNRCSHFNPNGIFGGRADQSGMVWYESREWLRLREVRLMLQI